jgi:hypothetical protein
MQKSLYIKWSGNGCHVHINKEAFSDNALGKTHPLELKEEGSSSKSGWVRVPKIEREKGCFVATLVVFSIPFCVVFPALLEDLGRILRVGMLGIGSSRTKPCLA